MKKYFRRLAALLCALALCLTSVSALSVQDALGLLEDNYVDELPAAAYEARTLDELFDIIGDPYTYYMTAADYDAFNEQVEGETTVTGIGVAIEYTANGLLITSVLSGGGGEEAGLKPGDVIIAADGISCVPGNEQHRNLIRGEAGTYVTITILHTDGSEQDYRIERRTITLLNTTVTVENGVGLIDCNSFGSNTAEYFYDALEENDDDVRFWLVDLRGNTGGVANAAVGALGFFTGYGPKLYYRMGDNYSFYSYYAADRLTNKPVIVLVNGYSASASEILAGGIRAQSAGVILGSRTYGKGTAQIVLDQDNYPQLFDGDSLKVTVYRFYCSDGDTTDKIGVIPTLLVSDQYAVEIAELLSAERLGSGDCLRMTLNGFDFYIDLQTARTDTYSGALSELLSALPPETAVRCNVGGATLTLSPAQTAQKLGVPFSSRSFNDVSSSPYAVEINTLGAYGILTGVGGGRFNPNGTLTRAELCAMLAQALNVTNDSAGLFSDVSANRWYNGSVNAMARLGFMTGVGGGRFDPNGMLTQEQFIATMGRLARFLNFQIDDYAYTLTDADFLGEGYDSLHSWARTGANILTEYDGNMLYTELSEINPSAPVTREQAAATLYNLLKALNILSY